MQFHSTTTSLLCSRLESELSDYKYTSHSSFPYPTNVMLGNAVPLLVPAHSSIQTRANKFYFRIMLISYSKSWLKSELWEVHKVLITLSRILINVCLSYSSHSQYPLVCTMIRIGRWFYCSWRACCQQDRQTNFIWNEQICKVLIKGWSESLTVKG